MPLAQQKGLFSWLGSHSGFCATQTPRRRERDPFTLPFSVCVYAQGHKGTSLMRWWGGAILLSYRVKFLADFILEKIKAPKKKEAQLADSPINSYSILSLCLVFSGKTLHSSNCQQHFLLEKSNQIPSGFISHHQWKTVDQWVLKKLLLSILIFRAVLHLQKD